MLNVTHNYFPFAIRCTIFQQMPCFASKVREQMPCFAFKDFLPIFYKCLLYIHGQVQNVAANASLCTQNIQNENAWNPKFLGKSWTEALFCIHRLWTNALIRIQDDGTNGLLCKCLPSHSDCLNKACCASKTFEQIPLLRIQDFWSNSAFHPKCLNKCLGSHPKCEQITSFASKMFEQVPFLALKMFEQVPLLYNQHARTNVLIRTSMFEQIPCFCFLFF